MDKKHRMGLASGTIPLDCLGSGIEVGLWIEMVITLCLSFVNAKVPPKRGVLCATHLFS